MSPGSPCLRPQRNLSLFISAIPYALVRENWCALKSFLGVPELNIMQTQYLGLRDYFLLRTQGSFVRTAFAACLIKEITRQVN